MPSPFDAEMEGLDAEISAEMAERVRLEPHAASGMFAAGADQQRAPRELLAVVNIATGFSRHDTSSPNEKRPPLALDESYVSFSERDFAARDDWPKQGDKIVALEQSPQVTLIVTHAERDGAGGIGCTCRTGP